MHGFKRRVAGALQAPLPELEPRFSPAWFGLARRLSGWYLKNMLKISAVSVQGLDVLVELYRRLERDEARFIIAFRHPHPDDGPVVFNLVSRLVPERARAAGRPLARPAHAWLVYGRDVPVWNGAASAFILPRLGAVPFLHNTLESASVGKLREYMLEGRAPVALAPEGQVSYSTDRLGPIDPGAAWLALWCREDLQRAGRPKPVYIVPLSTRCRYDHSSLPVLEGLLERIEAECGLTGGRFIRPYQRVERLRDSLLDRMVELYKRQYRGFWPEGEPAGGQDTIDRVVEAALRAAESALGVKPAGGSVRRVYELRRIGLARIFRGDLPARGSLAPLDRSLADRLALEAWLALRHMELVDLLEYLKYERFEEGTPLDHHIEAAQDLHDIVNRLEGGNIGGRSGAFAKRYEAALGEPMELGELPAPRGRRRCAEELSRELVRRFRLLI